MDVKQSFQNMVGWAKKNPVLAGGIVLVLVLIAWWVSKQSGGSSSEISTSDEASDPGLDFSAGLPLASDGDSGTLLDSVNNASGGITQTPPVYDAPVFESLPPISELTDAGMFDPGAYQDAVFAAPSVSPVSTAIAEMSSQPVTMSGYSVGGGLASAAAATPRTGIKPSSKSPLKLGGKGTKKAQPDNRRQEGLNPAQLLGKGKNFTGYINGVYYVKGYPVGQGSATTATGITPSSKSPFKRGGRGTTK